ncbi:TolC family protein [Vicingaceae bacterium]|nr:TolC family protein [Vicingaceae bacterium]MDC0004766.1 TolC family protein [bacterium]MDC1450959.1 TolC family protein [Vicingaceae bacterium]
MYNIKSNLIAVLFLVVGYSSTGFAQAESFEFTLQEAQNYAIKNSYMSINADKDVQIADNKVLETIGTGLPQINASGSFQRYVQTPLSLIPADVFGGPEGEFAEIFLGTEMQAGANLRVDQLLFSGSYIVGLQAAKTYLQISKNDKKKTEIEVKNIVTVAYGNALVALRNIEILKGNVKSLEQSAFEIGELYKNGFAEEQDKDQIELTLANVKNAQEQAVRTLDVVNNQLKFILGMDISSTLNLTDDLKTVTSISTSQEYLSKEFDVSSHIDYQIISTQEKATSLLLKQQKSTALPSLSAFYNLSSNAFANEFDFLDNKRFYNGQLVGLNLNIPLFSGFGRMTRIQQARLNVEKIEVAKKQVEQQLTIEAANSKSQYTFALSQYNTTEGNLDLAQRIYDKTKIKYEEGISSSLELTQANNQLLQSQSRYISSAFQLIQAKSNLDKALNQ